MAVVWEYDPVWDRVEGHPGMTEHASLPAFRNPPVVETVLGVQFDRLAGFTNAHLGAFWKHLREVDTDNDTWVSVSDAPPIDPTFETFDFEPSWDRPGFALYLGQPPTARVQIRNHAGDAMVQLQNGRLHYNWIGSAGRDYRRYNVVRPAFDRIHGIFESFLKSEKLGPIRHNQWEVTYVNHIPKGTVWNSPSDWMNLFVGVPMINANNDVRLESISAAWHFEIPPRLGRLHVDLRHANVSAGQQQEILRLTLTARGPTDAQVTWGSGLDLGRRTIVMTFKGITARAAHEYWELQE